MNVSNIIYFFITRISLSFTRLLWIELERFGLSNLHKQQKGNYRELPEPIRNNTTLK